MIDTPMRLGINIDHVATVRNARGGVHPDPIRAARLAVAAGGDNITAHLREDRRHITEADVERLLREISAPLNLELGATEEMVAIAKKLRPPAVCLVPERRAERTTEGGLDVVANAEALKPLVAALGEAEIQVALFVEPAAAQLEAARALGAPAVELHTGAYQEACFDGGRARIEAELARLRTAAADASSLGLEVHAGHGLDYANIRAVSRIPQIVEVNVGHFLVGEAVFVGLGAAIGRMRALIDETRRAAA